MNSSTVHSIPKGAPSEQGCQRAIFPRPPLSHGAFVQGARLFRSYSEKMSAPYPRVEAPSACWGWDRVGMEGGVGRGRGFQGCGTKRLT